jgi:hypothetical protein
MARSTSAKTEAKGEIEVDLEPEHVLGTDIPKYYATSIQTMASGNNVSLVFSGQRPIIIGTGAHKGKLAAQTIPVCTLDMSPQTAKDLFAVLKTVIDSYEKDWGPIDTPYQRALKGSQKRRRDAKSGNGGKR